MYVLVTYKNEEDQMKNECARMFKTLYLRHSMAANSIVGSQVWPKNKLFKAFIAVLDACKNDKDPSKNESNRVLTTLLPL